MKQSIINCPNEKYGYPKNYKGRKLSNPDIAHCPITNKWWDNKSNLYWAGNK